MTRVTRPAEPTDVSAIAALLRETFPRNPKGDERVLRWQQWDNPYGPSVAWVVDDRGRLVAHFCGFPLPARVDGSPTTLLKSADAATRPELRGQGVFPDLVRRVTEGARDAGAAGTLYAPSNPASRRPLERLGMRDVGRVGVWVRPVDLGWLSRRAHLPRPVVAAGARVVFGSRRGADLARVTAVPDVVARAPVAPTGVERDPGFWEWRYLAHPLAPYTLLHARTDDGDAAAAVIEREAFGARFLHVLDVVGDTEAATSALLAGISGAFPAADGVAAIAILGSPRARALAAAGLRRVPERLAPSTLAVGVLAEDPGATARLASRDWDVSWADLDHL